jgi:hypothetical protein
MTMEHRWNIRMSIKIDVEICYPGQAVAIAHGQTRDLSGDGVYAVVGTAAIPQDTFVEVRFVLRDNTNDQSFQVPAIITRSDKGGVGLMFVGHDPETYERLVGLLQYHLGILADRQVQGFGGRYLDTAKR